MSRKTRVFMGSCVATLLLVGAANGQEGDGGDGPGFAMIEIYGCSFNAGSDMADVMEVTDQFNEWADERGITDYTSNILTPYFYSTAFPYDLIFLGVSPTPESMGDGLGQWISEGGEVRDAFAEVIDCSIHAQFVGVAAHIPADPPSPDDGAVNLVSFQDCSVRENRGPLEAVGAHRRWGDFLAEQGSDLFMGALFPFAGEDPAAEYDYKAITNFPSAEAYGSFVGAVVPGGLQRAAQIFGNVTECDTSRIYVVNQVRAAEDDD